MKEIIDLIRLKLACWKANMLHKTTKQQYYVIKYQGRPKVFSSRQIKYMKKVRILNKKLSWEKLQEVAIYKTA